jgi:hypothetical protein
VTAPEACVASVAISAADGFEGKALIVPASALTDDWIALVSFGKSPFAELTSAFASL